MGWFRNLFKRLSKPVIIEPEIPEVDLSAPGALDAYINQKMIEMAELQGQLIEENLPEQPKKFTKKVPENYQGFDWWNRRNYGYGRKTVNNAALHDINHQGLEGHERNDWLVSQGYAPGTLLAADSDPWNRLHIYFDIWSRHSKMSKGPSSYIDSFGTTHVTYGSENALFWRLFFTLWEEYGYDIKDFDWKNFREWYSAQ